MSSSLPQFHLHLVTIGSGDAGTLEGTTKKTLQRKAYSQAMTAFLSVTYLFYPTLSMMQFQALPIKCIEFKEGGLLLELGQSEE